MDNSVTHTEDIYFTSDMLNCFNPPDYHDIPSRVLNQGIQHMVDRANTYDKPQGERSMKATVGAFNAATGHKLTEEQGWLFMVFLKAIRSQQGNFKMDNYEDGAAYFALMAEAGNESRSNG